MAVELRSHARVGRKPAAARRLAHAEETAPPEKPVRIDRIPPVSTVFRTIDGEMRHARCGHPIEFVGTRGGLEIDFYCRACLQHVTLSASALNRLVVAPGVPS